MSGRARITFRRAGPEDDLEAVLAVAGPTPGGPCELTVTVRERQRYPFGGSLDLARVPGFDPEIRSFVHRTSTVPDRQIADRLSELLRARTQSAENRDGTFSDPVEELKVEGGHGDVHFKWQRSPPAPALPVGPVAEWLSARATTVVFGHIKTNWPELIVRTEADRKREADFLKEYGLGGEGRG